MRWNNAEKWDKVHGSNANRSNQCIYKSETSSVKCKVAVGIDVFDGPH